MNKRINLWVKSMEIARKYWGCHQIPERSIFVCGYQFPVCSRCMGIMIGGILSIILAVSGVLLSLWISCIIIFPMIIDGGIQYKFNVMSTNLRRILTGILFGVGIPQSIIGVCLKIF